MLLAAPSFAALSSSEVKDLADKYQWSFDLIYDVILTAKKLELSLHISNTSSPDLPPMRFHALTHTYFKVPSAETCSIEGLGGQEYLDKTDGAKKKTLPEGESLVLHGKEHDAVYLGPTPKTLTLLYHPDQGKQGGGIEVVREDENTPQTVVWNIAEKEGAKMKDLHEGGWKEYICIEPGKVEGPQELEKGKKVSPRRSSGRRLCIREADPIILLPFNSIVHSETGFGRLVRSMMIQCYISVSH